MNVTPDLDGLKAALVEALSAVVRDDRYASKEFQRPEVNGSNFIADHQCCGCTVCIDLDPFARTIHESVAAPLLERIAELEAERDAHLERQQRAFGLYRKPDVTWVPTKPDPAGGDQ